MKTINVIHIHGIGGDKKNSHQLMIKNIRKELPKNIKLRIFPVKYLIDINKNQEENYNNMNQGKDKKRLRPFGKLRKFVLNFLGDALTVHYTQKEYEAVKKQIHTAILLSNNGNETAVVSQSLGCHLFSSYMWDTQKIVKKSKLSHLKIWFSTGNNMRVFFHGISPRKITPFKKPCEHFKWFNFWNWGDLLGYPMKNINDTYNELHTKDIHVKGVPIISHSRYNRKKKVYGKIAKELAGL